MLIAILDFCDRGEEIQILPFFVVVVGFGYPVMNDIHLNGQVTSDKDSGSDSTACESCKTHRLFIDSLRF